MSIPPDVLSLPPVLRIKQIFETWELRPVLNHLMAENPKLTWDHVKNLVVEYRRYLWLRATFPHLQLPVSHAVNSLWQEHLLFTQDYRQMCEMAGVIFIDHHPDMLEKQAFDATTAYRQILLPLYHREFGAPNPKFWPTLQVEACYD